MKRLCLQCSHLKLVFLCGASLQQNENVMFVDDERDPNNIRVLDFGLAKRFDGVHRILDRNGTVYTMSPEALRGEYSEKADMVSDGLIAAESTDIGSTKTKK